MGSVILLILVLIILAVVVIVLNSPSHIVQAAEKKVSEGKYDEAEELYRKVWFKTTDAPRLLCEMYLSIAKKQKSANKE